MVVLGVILPLLVVQIWPPMQVWGAEWNLQMGLSLKTPKTMNAQAIIEKHIADDNFPCLMGKSTLKSDTLKIVDYQYFNNVESTRKLYQDLLTFTKSVEGNSKKFYSFIASFSVEKIRSEKQFETVM